jgi:GNAT superfamily N-acetyltransferase
MDEAAAQREAPESWTSVTLRPYAWDERPDLIEPADALMTRAWHPFMRQDAVATTHWDKFASWFSAFQVVLCDPCDRVVAEGNTIPIAWDGTMSMVPAGWDAALDRGVGDYAAHRTPSTLAALAATVDPDCQGHGISRLLLEEMRNLAARHGLRDLIAPVRPWLKCCYAQSLAATRRHGVHGAPVCSVCGISAASAG